MFLAFSLANVLRPTTACTLSTSQLPKVPRSEASLAFSLKNITNVLCATTACTVPTLQLPKVFECELFSFFTFKCASRPNGMHSSLIWSAGAALAAFGCLLFDPLEPHIRGKTQCCATFLFGFRNDLAGREGGNLPSS